ncbi:NACHT domain-containing protein [Mastigocoleus testarum]|uniref:NACHT domain-containing protein n=1 Tax=Mastigocoleus testarum BC008 TaxID=371196 RepID=A0A0V7ZLB4_9CYAN|nr:NACHT domain-containing protein [Mastigocoleus testarum]KST65186.1 hypothetical protein BC008_20545 [Mastigocoleus testarum BC008]
MLNPILRLVVAGLFVALGGYLINHLPAIPYFRGRKFLTLSLTFEITTLSLLVSGWKDLFSKSSSFQVTAGPFGVIVLLLFFWHISQLGWRIYQVWKLSYLTHQNKIKVLKTPKDWRRELLKAMKRDVESRLNNSLQNQEIIRVGTYIQPHQVGRKPLVKNNGESQLESGKPIIEAFDKSDIAGRLLILGEPGAGKTTLLLELARDLLERAQQNPDYPIPVLFELTNWRDDKQSIEEWLIDDLKFRYNVSEKISGQWLSENKLLPLLDGLDELGSTRQEKCIDKINDFLQKNSNLLPLVVCCRREEYEQGEKILNLQGAVYLQALSEGQIKEYLRLVGVPKLWKNLQNDPHGLGELAKIPLFLSLIPTAYPDGLENQLKRFNSEKERKEYQLKIRKELFDNYIERKLEEHHNRKGYKPENTKRWLIWLAKKMEKHNLQEFYLEKIEPSYLDNTFEKIQYLLIISLIPGLISGLVIAMSFYRNSGLIVGLFYGVVFALIYGFICLYPVPNDAKEAFKISFDLKSWLIFLLISGLIITLIPGLIPILTFGLIFVFNKGTELEDRKNPNQGIQESAKNIIVLIFIVLPIVISFLAIAAVHIHGQNLYVTSIIIREFLGVIIFVVALTGITVVQHISLRIILWTNRSIPWNYAYFLTYASDRKLINKVGGRFTFIHTLLQKHFAQMES